MNDEYNVVLFGIPVGVSSHEALIRLLHAAGKSSKPGKGKKGRTDVEFDSDYTLAKLPPNSVIELPGLSKKLTKAAQDADGKTDKAAILEILKNNFHGKMRLNEIKLGLEHRLGKPPSGVHDRLNEAMELGHVKRLGYGTYKFRGTSPAATEEDKPKSSGHHAKSVKRFKAKDDEYKKKALQAAIALVNEEIPLSCNTADKVAALRSVAEAADVKYWDIRLAYSVDTKKTDSCFRRSDEYPRGPVLTRKGGAKLRYIDKKLLRAAAKASKALA